MKSHLVTRSNLLNVSICEVAILGRKLKSTASDEEGDRDLLFRNDAESPAKSTLEIHHQCRRR